MKYTSWEYRALKTLKNHSYTVRDLALETSIPYWSLNSFIREQFKQGIVTRERIDQHSHHEYIYTLVKDVFKEKTVEWRAWLAGFFDGEGSVHAHIRTYKNKLGEPSLKSIILTTSIGNTCKEVMELIKSSYGGYWRVTTRKRRKTYYVLTWSARQALVVLLDIKPYLKVKNLIADKAIELLDLVQERRQETKDTRLSLANQIREINNHSKLTWNGKKYSTSRF